MDKAASYSRRSDARGKRKDERSVEEQDKLSLRAAAKNGWDLPPTHMYRDNDLSASRYSNKERPDWERLEPVISSGEIQVLILNETSRAWRKLAQWVMLVDTCRDSRVLMHITSHGKTYDPTNRRDRKTLIEEGVDSEDETEKISERVKRAMDENKEEGRPHSRPPYGYEIQIDPSDPRKTIRAIVPELAAIVKEVITRVAKSEAQTVIIRDLTSRGISSPSVAQGLTPHPRSNGKTPQWSRAMIRRICTNEAYIGMRGDVKATWEPIMKTEEEVKLFYAARSLIKDPARKTTKPGSQKHLLAFFATCEVCGSYVTRMGGSNPHERYKCSSDSACVTIRKDWVDDLIVRLTCARLAKPDVFEELTRRDDNHLYVELEKLRAEYNQAREYRNQGKLTLDEFIDEKNRYLPRIEEIEASLTPVSIPQVVRDLVDGANNSVDIIRERWEALAVSAQKDVLRTLFQYIKIDKSPVTGRLTTDEQIAWMLKQRVHIRWVGQAA